MPHVIAVCTGKAERIQTMKYFNKNQRQELIEFIDKTASSFDFNAFGIDHNGDLAFITSEELESFTMFRPNGRKYDYHVALDQANFSECHDMSIPETKTLQEQKNEIEKIMFETVAMDYLTKCLPKKKLGINLNIGELGEFVNCEIYFPNGVRCDAFIWYCPGEESDIEIVTDTDEDEENFFSCTFSGGNMKAIKKLIRTTVSKWVEENPTLKYLKSYSNKYNNLI